MHFLADVRRLEVLAEVLGQQMAPVRRRVDQRRSTDGAAIVPSSITFSAL